MSFHDLPFDIIERLPAYADPFFVSPRELPLFEPQRAEIRNGFPDLEALSCVNRTMRKLCLPILFSAIYVLLEETEVKKSSSVLSKFTRLISKRAHIRELIRYVTVRIFLLTP
jgi:hypothetical protein